MRHISFCVLFLAISSAYGEELVKFQNGNVADANDINANFEQLQREITNKGVCSVQQDGNNAVISCPDGSEATIVGPSPSAENTRYDLRRTLFESSCSPDDFVGTWVSWGNTGRYKHEWHFWASGALGEAEYESPRVVMHSYYCPGTYCNPRGEVGTEWGTWLLELSGIGACQIYVSTGNNMDRRSEGLILMSPSKSTMTGSIDGQESNTGQDFTRVFSRSTGVQWKDANDVALGWAYSGVLPVLNISSDMPSHKVAIYNNPETQTVEWGNPTDSATIYFENSDCSGTSFMSQEAENSLIIADTSYYQRSFVLPRDTRLFASQIRFAGYNFGGQWIPSTGCQSVNMELDSVSAEKISIPETAAQTVQNAAYPARLVFEPANDCYFDAFTNC